MMDVPDMELPPLDNDDDDNDRIDNGHDNINVVDVQVRVVT